MNIKNKKSFINKCLSNNNGCNDKFKSVDYNKILYVSEKRISLLIFISRRHFRIKLLNKNIRRLKKICCQT